MKIRTAIVALALGALVFAAPAVHAATYTSQDGVISMDAPNDLWVMTTDPNHWFVMSDGKNAITVDHLSNGENLPAVTVADSNHQSVFQAFVSTTNEVFVVKGLATEAGELESLMRAISSLKVLKYDTKKAIAVTPLPTAAEFSIRPINSTYYVVTDLLNVRNGCSTDDAKLGTVAYGDAVTVNGAVTKGGADYGWYQIQFNGGIGYCVAEFLSPNAPTGPKPSAASGNANNTAANTNTNTNGNNGPVALASGFPAYDGNGHYQGILIPYSDGLYRTSDMVAYKDNGNGSYTPVNGGGFDLYDSSTGLSAEYQTLENGATVLSSGFAVYDSYGNYQGIIRPYSDGLYYSIDMVGYVDNGDGSYTGGGETLYEYVHGESDDAPSGDFYAIDDAFAVYDENGNYAGTLCLYNNGYYYSGDMVAFSDNGDGSFSGGGMVLYSYGSNGAVAYNDTPVNYDLEYFQCELCGEWVQEGIDYRQHLSDVHGIYWSDDDV